MTKQIKLPPLPNDSETPASSEWQWSDTDMQAYATAAIEADRQTTNKQFAAYKRLTESLESRIALLQTQYDRLKKATDPSLLESERAVIAMLTEELEACRKRTADLISAYQGKVRALEAENYSLVSGLDDRKARGEPASNLSDEEILEIMKPGELMTSITRRFYEDEWSERDIDTPKLLEKSRALIAKYAAPPADTAMEKNHG